MYMCIYDIYICTYFDAYFGYLQINWTHFLIFSTLVFLFQQASGQRLVCETSASAATKPLLPCLRREGREVGWVGWVWMSLVAEICWFMLVWSVWNFRDLWCGSFGALSRRFIMNPSDKSLYKLPEMWRKHIKLNQGEKLNQWWAVTLGLFWNFIALSLGHSYQSCQRVILHDYLL